MTRKEFALIRAEIEQYRKWAAEEEAEAKRATSLEDKELHYMQSRLNDCAADTLDLLLCKLSEI